MSMSEKTATCPTCRKRFNWDSRPESRPFCSERCRMIDLGDWFEEKHRIPDSSSERPFLPPEQDYDS